jgi:hypothetical protein
MSASFHEAMVHLHQRLGLDADKPLFQQGCAVFSSRKRWSCRSRDISAR